MIKLHRFSPAWGLSCCSYFVLKLETYMRMAGIPYEAVSLGLSFGTVAPKGKLPFIEDDGKKIADTAFIIDHLVAKFGDRLDAGLSPVDKATGHCIRRLLEENTRWVMACERWRAPEEPYYDTPGLFKEQPRAVYEGARDHYLRQLNEHGMGVYTPEELAAIGKADIDALSDILGTKRFFLGDKPTSVDATAFGFLQHILATTYTSPLRNEAKKKRNLVDYVARMQERYFSASVPAAAE